MDRKKRDKMMRDFYKEIEIPKILPEIKEINLRYCEDSSTYKINNKWKNYTDISEVLYNSVYNSLKRKIDEDVKLEVEPLMKGSKIKELRITGKKGKFQEEITVKAKIDKTMNPSLSKKYSKYLEGTLQIRNLNENMFEYLQELLEISEDKSGHVIDLREKGKSVDIDMTSQKEIERIAKGMQKEFGGNLKMDYKLHTRDKQTQKELYRLNATIILPDVRKGDYINFENETFKVISIIKDKMKVYSLENETKIMIGLDEKYDILKKETSIIARTEPNVMIIDPETFQMNEIKLRDKNNTKKIKINQKLEIVKNNNKIFSTKK